jgi:MOSC domain-containing protein
MHDLALQGTVIAVCADGGHRFSKAPQRDIRLVEGHGVEGDAHAGAFVRHRYIARRQPRLPNLRQVHLISSELFEALRITGYDVGPGALGENITTAGLDLEQLSLRTRIRLGPTAAVELTGLRAPCVLIDRFQAGLKRLVMSSEKTGPLFKCGVMAVVTTEGRVAAGDRASVLLPEGNPIALPSL